MLSKKQVITIVSVAVVSFLIGTTFHAVTMGSDGGNPFDNLWETIYGLQSGIDGCNASYIELLDRVEALEAKFPVKTNDIADSAVVTVKLADGSVTSAKILDGTITAADLAMDSVTSFEITNGQVRTEDIADFSVSDMKLSWNAIPHGYASSTHQHLISDDWEFVSGMSIEINLNRAADLLVMFTAEVFSMEYPVFVRAKVYSYATGTSLQTHPQSDEIVLNEAYDDWYDDHHSGNAYPAYQKVSAGYNSYLNRGPGLYRITIECKKHGTQSAYLEERSLFVIALPT